MNKGNPRNTKFLSLHPLTMEEALKTAMQAGPLKEDRQAKPKARKANKDSGQ